ncbi:MAG: hypothetical protein ACRER2_18800 [Methylococcales bacterium]
MIPDFLQRVDTASEGTSHGFTAGRINLQTPPGMDRFRVLALEKIIALGHLSLAQHRAAGEMLVAKARIYRKGARKRNKIEQAVHYESLCTRYAIDE